MGLGRLYSWDADWSQQQEALWCEVRRLRLVLKAFEQDMANAREIIRSQRQLLEARVKAKPSTSPSCEGGVCEQKCGYEPCHEQLQQGKRFCSRSHMMRERWERGGMPRQWKKKGSHNADIAESVGRTHRPEPVSERSDG